MVGPLATTAPLASIPLQSTGAGGSGALLAAVLFPLLAWTALVVWVYQDAVARDGDHLVGSTVAVALFPPALVAYVRYRDERTRPPSDRERLTLTVLLALLSAMMAGTVLSPPDVFAQPRNTFGALLVTLPLFYLLVYRGNDAETDAGTTP